MPAIDYEKASSQIKAIFAVAEANYLQNRFPSTTSDLRGAYDTLFASKTQAYREVLLGCVVVRLQNPSIDIRLPYVNQGEMAYNGRTLDERVINPFLRNCKIPCSKGPFLNVFRRQVRFDDSTREGLRDKAGYDAFLSIISHIENSSIEELQNVLYYHLHCFIVLREEAKIEISRIRRISLEQCDLLISKLLDTQSGGRFPVFLIVSTFQTIKEVFNLDWEIEFQGINVADKASGTGGDITIRRNGNILLSAEITERTVDQQRVVATFDTKIAPYSIEDYLFFIKDREASGAAIKQAKKYFSQGHEVNFLEIKNWIIIMLSLLGTSGRNVFINKIIEFLEADDTPKSVKISWNDSLSQIISAE